MWFCLSQKKQTLAKGLTKMKPTSAEKADDLSTEISQDVQLMAYNNNLDQAQGNYQKNYF